MKKLFALVLVLAMALAIAVPALAATGWDLPAVPTPDPYEDFEMTAEKYEYYGSTAGGYADDDKYFANWDDKKGIVKDTLGRVYFELDVPTAADAALRYPGVDFTNLKYSIKITNVKSVGACVLTGTVDYMPTLDTTVVSAKNVFAPTATTVALGAPTVKLMYVFAAASAADVVATISISSGTATLGTVGANFTYKTVAINAAVPSANHFTFTVASGSYAGNMRFETNSADKIERVFLTVGTTGYQVLVDVNGVVSFAPVLGTPTIQVGQVEYAPIKTVYDFYMSALGFSWDNTTKYMTETLILKNLFKGVDGDLNKLSVVFPAGYQSIVDPTVQPPQTGDASTVVGFVMIALALVAAAAVTVKKVRA